MVFLTELATNATDHEVRVVVYSGNDDSLVAHIGSEGESSRAFIHLGHMLMYLSRNTGTCRMPLQIFRIRIYCL